MNFFSHWLQYWNNFCRSNGDISSEERRQSIAASVIIFCIILSCVTIEGLSASSQDSCSKFAEYYWLVRFSM